MGYTPSSVYGQPNLSDFVLEKNTLSSYIVVVERDIVADIYNKH